EFFVRGRAYKIRRMDQDQKIRSRARLALRAERAFGLRALAVRTTAAVEEASNAAAEATVVDAVRAVVDLFGKPLTQQRAQVALATLDAFTAPAPSRDEKIAKLRELDANEVAVCTNCRLCERRKQTVFGEGDPDAKIMFI